MIFALSSGGYINCILSYCIVYTNLIESYVEVIYMKVKTTMFSMRLPDDLREKLEAMATREGRTLTNLIIYLLRKAVEE